MSDIIKFTASLLAGVCLGTVYFGGLWYTLRQLMRARSPAVLLISSYFLRGAVVFAGLMLVGRAGDWEALLICLGGLLAVRLVMVRRWGVRQPAVPIGQAKSNTNVLEPD